MADRTTGSLWTHYDGSVIQGPLAGTGVALEIVPTVHVRWADWITDHPDSMVLDWYPEYADRYRNVNPGGGSLSDRFESTVLNFDDRLGRTELVLGVYGPQEATAYVLEDLPNQLTVIMDELEGGPIAVFVDPSSFFGLAYSAVVDGAARRFSVSNGVIIDDAGNEWSNTGLAVAGPDAGLQLSYVTSFITEWYGWAAYHPETAIYRR